MFDLHSHILPFVDDGAKDVEMSLAMLKTAKEQGVELVAATPHCMAKDSEAVDDLLEKRQNSYEKLISAIKDKSEYPEIILGSEIHLCKDISDYPNLAALCYQNTNYILLELPDKNSPSEIAEWIYNISIKGFRPVIAHIDRYPDYDEIMDELSHLDVIYQVNAARFLTMGDRHLLKKIFKGHNKFFVSSDMHNVTTRVSNMGRAKEIADKKFSAMSNMLFEEGGRAVVENRSFPDFR